MARTPTGPFFTETKMTQPRRIDPWTKPANAQPSDN